MGPKTIKCNIIRNVQKIFGKDTDTNLKKGDKLIKVFTNKKIADPPLDVLKPRSYSNVISVCLERLTTETKLLKKGKQIAEARTQKTPFKYLGKIVLDYNYLNGNEFVKSVKHCDEMNDCSHCHITYNIEPGVNKTLSPKDREEIVKIYQNSRYIKVTSTLL